MCTSYYHQVYDDDDADDDYADNDYDDDYDDDDYYIFVCSILLHCIRQWHNPPSIRRACEANEILYLYC